MKNAKDELLEAIDQIGVIAAGIDYGSEWRGNQKNFHLKKSHSQSDWLLFLEQLNFVYDNGYGGQELFGMVWLEDGSWLERGEYDGSEWWERRILPQIPEELA